MVHVLPIEGEPPGYPAWTADTLADALQSRNLPATTRPSGSTAHKLRGWAVVQPVDDRQEEIMLHWDLQDPDGARVAAYRQRARLPKGAWRLGANEGIVEILEITAEAIARQVQDGQQAQRSVPGFPGARLVILPIRAPGDGSLSLARALAEELSRAGLPLAEHPGTRDLLIDCQVSLSPPGGYWREIRLSWAVNDSKNGRELGRIDQANRVPAEQLDGQWGQLSAQIAQGAAAGILDLLDQLGRAS